MLKSLIFVERRPMRALRRGIDELLLMAWLSAQSIMAWTGEGDDDEVDCRRFQCQWLGRRSTFTFSRASRAKAEDFRPTNDAYRDFRLSEVVIRSVLRRRQVMILPTLSTNDDASQSI